MVKLKKTFIASIPILLAYPTLGFMGGAMLAKTGFNVFDLFLVSIFIFSGSAVFIAAALLQVGIHLDIAMSLTATIIITNLRNAMYSSSLVEDTRKMPLLKKLLFTQFVSDETYAINKINFETDPSWDYDCAFYLNMLGCIYAMIGNCAGAYFGEIVNIPLDIGFFMMTSMFVVLLVLQVRNKMDILMMMIAIIISFSLLSVYRGSLHVILVGLIVTTIGYLIEKRGVKNEHNSN